MTKFFKFTRITGIFLMLVAVVGMTVTIIFMGSFGIPLDTLDMVGWTYLGVTFLGGLILFSVSEVSL